MKHLLIIGVVMAALSVSDSLLSLLIADIVNLISTLPSAYITLLLLVTVCSLVASFGCSTAVS